MLESGQRWKSAAITTSINVRFFNEVDFMNQKYIDILFKELQKALNKDEVPVSALIVNSINNKIVAKAYNYRISSNCTLDHAEIKCISKTNKCLRNKNLNNCDLYVTLEPCDMCKSIIKEARIRNVYYLIERNKEKKQYSKTNFENWNVDQDIKDRYKRILADFFKKRR